MKTEEQPKRPKTKKEQEEQDQRELKIRFDLIAEGKIKPANSNETRKST